MQQQNSKVTWAQAVRDVLNTAMNRGQLPLLFILLCCFLVLYRLPEEQLSLLVFKIMQGLKDGYLVGYALVVVILVIWYWDSRRIRRKYAELSTQYTKLQQKHTKNKQNLKNRRTKMMTAMTWLFYITLALAIGHFIYESIIAPNLRVGIRNELFEIKDELDLISLDELSENDKAIYYMLHSSLTGLMLRLPKLNLSLMKEAQDKFETDAKFRAKVLKKRQLIESSHNTTLKDLYRRSNNAFSDAFIINTGAWFMLLFPLLFVMKAMAKAQKIVSGIITLSTKQMQKLIPETEDELAYA